MHIHYFAVYKQGLQAGDQHKLKQKAPVSHHRKPAKIMSIDNVNKKQHNIMTDALKTGQRHFPMDQGSAYFFTSGIDY